MTLSFPPQAIEAAVAGAVTTYTRRVDIYEADNDTLWLRGAPLVDGSLTVQMGQQERRTMSLTLFNEGPLTIDRDDGFWYDKVIKVFMGVETPLTSWESCIGTFLIDRIDPGENNSKEVGLKLRDFSKKMGYNVPIDVGWAVNTPIENIVRDLALGAGIPLADINVPLTGESTYEDTTVQQGTSRWRAAYDLATAFGYDLFFDENGQLHMEEFTDPATSPPQFTFQVGVDSNISSIKRSVSDSLIYNHIVVEGETPEGVPVWGEALNENPASPTNTTKLGLRTKPTIQNSWVTSEAQADEVAERDLAHSSLERYEAELGTILIPWLDVNVTVNFIDPYAVSGDPIRYLLSKLTIPLDLGEASATLGRVTTV